jgi:polysaccharide export outer membrane protein
MPGNIKRSAGAILAVALSAGLGGCELIPFDLGPPLAIVQGPPPGVAHGPPPGPPPGVAIAGWGQTVVAFGSTGEGEVDGPYLLDAGDRLRIFVYGHPNLSRLYTVDQQGMVSVPLIGDVPARGRTTRALGRAVAARLAARYVRDPQVTVDVAQNRPFFILGEVRNAGQFPYVSGLTAKAAVAVAGGFADRADERRIQITRRRFDGLIEKMDVPPDYVVQPGDTLYVHERWL